MCVCVCDCLATMAKEPLAEPLLDLESGQATAPSTKTKPTTTHSLHKSDDFLPNIFKVGELVQEVSKKHPNRMRPQLELYKNGTKGQSWAAWTHYYSTYLPAILRSIKLVFLAEQGNLAGKGKAQAKGLMSNMRLVMSDANVRMIKAIQVAEKVKVMATEHKTVMSLLRDFLPTAQYTVLDGIEDEHIDNTRDQLETEIMMKFIHLFCLMALYAVPPVCTSVLVHFKVSTAKDYTVDFRHRCQVLLADPGELPPSADDDTHKCLQEKWSDPAPSGVLTFRDYVNHEFHTRCLSLPDSNPFTPADGDKDPLHPNWLKLDSGLLFAVNQYYDYLSPNDNSTGTEEKILTEFVDLLSSCIGDLKAELELVQQMRAKMISTASTGFLSVFTLLMHQTKAS